jgi:hypothetical protein
MRITALLLLSLIAFPHLGAKEVKRILDRMWPLCMARLKTFRAGAADNILID